MELVRTNSIASFFLRANEKSQLGTSLFRPEASVTKPNQVQTRPPLPLSLDWTQWGFLLPWRMTSDSEVMSKWFPLFSKVFPISFVSEPSHPVRMGVLANHLGSINHFVF